MVTEITWVVEVTVLHYLNWIGKDVKATQSIGKLQSDGQWSTANGWTSRFRRIRNISLRPWMLAFSDLGGASSWCSYHPRCDLVVTKWSQVTGHKTRLRNLKGQVGCMVDNEILQEDGRSSGEENEIRCQSIQLMREGTRRQQREGTQTSKGSDSEEYWHRQACRRSSASLKGPSIRDSTSWLKSACVQLPMVWCSLPLKQCLMPKWMERRNNQDQKCLGFISLLQVPLLLKQAQVLKPLNTLLNFVLFWMF